MKTKIPTITYVVKCKFKTNSAGLQTLHHQYFTNENFSEARKTAFEYVEAAKEFMHKNEVMLNRKRYQNPSGVYVKNREVFDSGIQIFIRINEAFNQFGISDKKDTMYLIAAFHTLNDDFRQRIKAGRLAEKTYYKILNQNTFEEDQFIIDYQKFDQEKNEIEKLKSQSFKDIDYIPYSIDQTIENLFESVCAFANSGGGRIIFGQDENFKTYHSDSKMDSFCEEIWNRTIAEFPKIEDYVIIYKRNYIDCKFLEIEVIPTPLDCLFKGEYFVRTIHGNVMDLEKSL
ncbi:MAG: ATP-binding protein [Chryseobacterium sp.]